MNEIIAGCICVFGAMILGAILAVLVEWFIHYQ